MATVRVTENNFEASFWAAWCGPCLAFGPVFEAAAMPAQPTAQEKA